MAQFHRGAGRPQFLLGLGAEPAHDRAGGVVEQCDKEPGGARERLLERSDPQGRAQRTGQGQVLRHQLTEDHLYQGGHQQRGHRAGGPAGIGVQPDGLERLTEGLGQHRLGQETEQQRADRDAQLGAGQVEGQVVHGVEYAGGTPVAVPGALVQPGTVNRGEGELGKDEDRIECDQADHRE